MLIIDNHRFYVAPGLGPIPCFEFRASPNVSARGAAVPSLIVIHYTASESYSGTIAHCCSPFSKVSYHLIIDRDGAVFQLAYFSDRAWHAGKGHYKEIQDINTYSIGIGLVNWGLLKRRADGAMCAWPKSYQLLVPHSHAFVLAAHKHTPEKNDFWDGYPPAQIESCRYVCNLIQIAYPIAEIIGHDDCARGRKVDPGPAFPTLPRSNFS